jgi:hypothetical protein
MSTPIFLNKKVESFFLLNNINALFGIDLMIGRPEGEEDQILKWDTAKLGSQPTYEQIDQAHETYQAQLTAQLAAQQTTAENLKQSALTKLEALGLTTNELKILIGM